MARANATDSVFPDDNALFHSNALARCAQPVQCTTRLAFAYRCLFPLCGVAEGNPFRVRLSRTLVTFQSRQGEIIEVIVSLEIYRVRCVKIGVKSKG